MTLDPQMRRYLTRIVEAGGRIDVPEFVDQLDEQGAQRALDLGYIKHDLDGGWGAHSFVAITNKGRAAMGLPPKPRWLYWLLTKLV